LDTLKTRCLVVADLHYSLPEFDFVLSAAPEFEAMHSTLRPP
jgi:hypothetical protein